MKRWPPIALLAFLAACALTPPSPERQACTTKMEAVAARLLPAFARLGYRPRVIISLDEALADNRGFAAPPQVYGDSSLGGRVRLRPLLCAQDALAVIVVAHEMSHVALAHWGMPSTRVSLAWEAPQQELEADGLARKVLEASGEYQPLADFLACRLGQCEALPPGWKHKPVGTRSDATPGRR